MDTAGVIEDILSHHGVKGMHWGQRKRRTGSVTRLKRNAEHPEHENASEANQAHAKARTSGTAALGNKELQSVVSRMNLEQQYSTLSARTNPSASAKGKKAVAGVLAVGATLNAAVAFANSPAGKVLRANIEKAVKK